MRVSNLKLNYSVEPEFEPRSVHVQLPEFNAPRVNPPRRGYKEGRIIKKTSGKQCSWCRGGEADRGVNPV